MLGRGVGLGVLMWVVGVGLWSHGDPSTTCEQTHATENIIFPHYIAGGYKVYVHCKRRKRVAFN